MLIGPAYSQLIVRAVVPSDSHISPSRFGLSAISPQITNAPDISLASDCGTPAITADTLIITFVLELAVGIGTASSASQVHVFTVDKLVGSSCAPHLELVTIAIWVHGPPTPFNEYSIFAPSIALPCVYQPIVKLWLLSDFILTTCPFIKYTFVSNVILPKILNGSESSLTGVSNASIDSIQIFAPVDMFSGIAGHVNGLPVAAGVLAINVSSIASLIPSPS